MRGRSYGLTTQMLESNAVHETSELRSPGQGGWYALTTCSRHEKRVAEQIERRSVQCFLPLYRSVRRWKDRRKELSLALFPGYVFVRMELQDKLKILQLPGVVRLVSFNGKPAMLPDAEIEALQARLSNDIRVEPHPYLRTGRRVRVRSGAMQGLEGIVVRRKEHCRVILRHQTRQLASAGKRIDAPLPLGRASRSAHLKHSVVVFAGVG